MSASGTGPLDPVTDGEARRAVVVGLGGQHLTSDEAGFLREFRPCGIIVFSRNFSTDAQLSQLIEDACTAAGGEPMLVLVDQEGGRVQRLRGGDWPDLPPAAAFGALYEADPRDGLEAAETCNRWLAGLLRGVGINVNCTPCLDVPVAGADGIIGDRAFSTRADVVAALGRAVGLATMAGGVVPVIKHIPGHGRATVDSHLALPVVDTERAILGAQDFAPFAFNNELPAAMTAHVTYRVIDAGQPASVSPVAVRDVIRGEIGFKGLLMSDDISMQALNGTLAERARRVIAAGSDLILHCNGVLQEMREVATVAPVLAGDALVRYRRCLGITRQRPAPVDDAAALAALQRVQAAWQERVGS